MTIYHADKATPEVLAQAQRLLAPVCEAIHASPMVLHRLMDIAPKGWTLDLRREQVRPAEPFAPLFAHGQGWKVRVCCYLRRIPEGFPGGSPPGPRVWTLPGWSLAGLVLLVADLGPEANWVVRSRGLDAWDHMGLWPTLEAVSSTILAGGYAGRLP